VISTLFCMFKKNSKVNHVSKLLIYKSYIRPILTHAGTVFLNCANIHLQKLQVFQNKCLRMALNKPYGTRNCELHDEAKIPLIYDFIKKNADKFYAAIQNHSNELVQQLGNYSTETLPFRVKHRLPRAL
jgi:hypothetical protein